MSDRSSRVISSVSSVVCTVITVFSVLWAVAGYRSKVDAMSLEQSAMKERITTLEKDQKETREALTRILAEHGVTLGRIDERINALMKR